MVVRREMDVMDDIYNLLLLKNHRLLQGPCRGGAEETGHKIGLSSIIASGAMLSNCSVEIMLFK